MNCLIIEDEKPAQRVLEQYIGNSPGLSLVGTFKTAMEAQRLLHSGMVDLIFLDINLPMISGIALLKSLKNPPLVIITTAYSEYALESFELDVVDYLLKPFPFERFVKATNKAFKLFDANKVGRSNEVQEVASEQVILNVDKVLYQVPLDKIQYIASDRDYVCIHTAERKYVFLDSLRNWEKRLAGSGFTRIHKSYVVNMTHITKIEGNRAFLSITELPIGRSYRSAFMEVFARC